MGFDWYIKSLKEFNWAFIRYMARNGKLGMSENPFHAFGLSLPAFSRRLHRLEMVIATKGGVSKSEIWQAETQINRFFLTLTIFCRLYNKNFLFIF